MEPAGGAQGAAAERLRRVVGALPAGPGVRRRRGSTDGGSALALEAAGAARLAGDPAAAAAAAGGRAAAPARHRAPPAPAPWSGSAASSGRPARPARSRAAYAEAATALGPEVTACHAQVWGGHGAGRVHHGRVRRGGPARRPGRGGGAGARHHRRPRRRADHPRHRRRDPRRRRRASTCLREGVALARDVEDRAVLCRSYANLMVAYECQRACPPRRAPPRSRGSASCRSTGWSSPWGRRWPPTRPTCSPAGATTSAARRCSPNCSTAGRSRARGCTCTSSGPNCSCGWATARAPGPAWRRPRRCEVDEPPVIAAVACATAELRAQEGDRDGCYRTVDDALRTLAATQDTRFRTELLVIGLRSEADRRGPVPGREDAGGEARLERLAAELDEVVPDADDDLDHTAHHRTARNELARVRGDGHRGGLGRRRPAVAGRRAAPRGGLLPAAGGRVPRGREAAGQGGRRGAGCAGDRRPDRRGAARGRRGRVHRPHPALGGARAPRPRWRTGPTG